MKSFGKCLSLLATVVALILTSTAPEARRQGYQVLLVFGDSLSDVGNDFLATKRAGFNPAIPPSESPHMTYNGARFSNGKVAVEYLWDLINPSPANSREAMKPSLAIDKIHTKGAVSFAFGGSGTGFEDPLPVGLNVPGLLRQVELFQVALKGKDVPDDSLVVVFSGANDYLVTPPKTPLSIAQVVGNIVTTVRLLYGLGAREMMVVNLPDLGLPPIVPPEAKGGLQLLTIAHNQALAAALAPLTQPGPALLPGLRLILIDAFAFVNSLVPTAIPGPDTFPAPALALQPGGGLVPNVSCLFVNPSECENVSFTVNPGFLFWDAQHPTTATHRAFGEFMHAQLQ